MEDSELETRIENIIKTVGAESIKDMSKVMGMATKELLGKVDNSRIATMIKEKIKLNFIDILFAFVLLYFSYKGFRKGL